MKISRLAIAGTALCVLAFSTLAGEIGYIEDFSLAGDRSVPLGQLIPGTDDFYYYTCLDHQNNGRLAEVEKLLPEWIKKSGENQRVKEIRNRQAMLGYDADSKKSIDYMVKEMNLQFNHQKEILDAQVNLPTALDPARVSLETFKKDAMARSPNSLDGFTDKGLTLLDPAALEPNLRRIFLQRIIFPDVANLADVVVADLKHKDSGGFGSMNIHSRLTLEQLDKCVALMPELRNQQNFVNSYVDHLRMVRPGWDEDIAARTACLDRIWNFVKQLEPSHNSLKANILFNRLKVDMEAGVFDKDRFLEYLKLPRMAPFIRQEYLRTSEPQGRYANLAQDFSAQTGFPVIGDENQLVRYFLLHFLATAEKYDDFAVYLDDKFVKMTFAEAKIVNGVGDLTQWFAMLTPPEHQALKERVDIDIAPTNRRFFSADEPVSLEVSTKNVSKLIVKTYTINLSNYYRDRKAEPGLDIDLDGVVANEEKIHEYKDSEFRKIPRKFEFPALKGRGAYVVEFTGNGKVSRYIIRKGRLSCVTKSTAAGQIFKVVDDSGNIVAKPSIWLDGHLYEADKDGVLVVPFSNEPAQQKVVVYDGAFCSLADFDQQSENYSLMMNAHVDRESLISGCKAQAIIRAKLDINGEKSPLSLLKNVRLTVASQLLDGSSSVKTAEDFELSADKESVYEFYVPAGLRNISFTLEGEIANLSRGKDDKLSDSRSFELNGIDSKNATEELLLSREGGDHILRLLGKNGEALPNRAVNLQISNSFFRFPANATLKTDAQGCIKIGKTGCDGLTANAKQSNGTWPISGKDAAVLPGIVVSPAGKELAIPCAGRISDLGANAVSLIECRREGMDPYLRQDVFLADHTAKLAVKDGFVRIAGLPEGDFILRFKETGEIVLIRTFDGAEKEGIIISKNSLAAACGSDALSITGAGIENGVLTMKLANSADDTRVHVFFDRFQPMFDAFSDCKFPLTGGPLMFRLSPESRYESGRTASEEFEYILRRRYSEKYAGNMLDRPGLLLNPFALKKTETGREREAQLGEAFHPAPEAAGTLRSYGALADRGKAMNAIAQGIFSPTLDFLMSPSAVMLNLKPDKNGVVSIPLEKIGDRQEICILALGANGASMTAISMPACKLETRDMRMKKTLDTAKHFMETKKITAMKPDETLEIRDFASAKYEIYDTVGRVYNLFSALDKDPSATLAEFSFIRNWSRLGDDMKQEKYSKYACNELNFFLYCKDRPFFDKVVMPYLKNKRNKTFMDDFLVGNPLDAYLAPAVYRNRLNAAEKALLASKMKGEAETSIRFLRESFEMLPPDPEKADRLFRMALNAQAEEAMDPLKFAGNARDEMEGKADRAAAAKPAMQAKGALAKTAGAVPAAPPPEAAKKKQADATRKLEAADKDSLALKEGEVGEKRRQAVQFYRKIDKTDELAENNYYKLPFEKQDAGLVPVNAFWVDLAGAGGNVAGFRSVKLAEAASSFSEMALALAAIDLPFKAEKHDIKVDGTSLMVKTAGPAIVFHKEIVEVQAANDRRSVLVAENLFKDSDRYEFDGGQKIDKFVKGELLIGEVYGCMVAVTNPGSTPIRIELMIQIPAGAIPVDGAAATDSKPFVLEGFSTRAFEYRFYFPKAGEFAHYPAHVSSNGTLAAFCQPSVLKVVDTPVGPDKTSWEYVSQNGSDDEVLAFLATHNLNRLNLMKIAFRMKDKVFFGKVIGLLGKAHSYDDTLWSYSLMHNDLPTMRDYLERSPLAVACGDRLVSSPLVVDPVRTGAFQFLEYSPLVNARICQLGKKRTIQNETLLGQYTRLLKVLSYSKSLSDEEHLAVSYYLFLQDRVPEAIAFFGKVDPAKVAERIQYDYCQAYGEFCKGNADAAVKIAKAYADYQVPKWRNRFQEILSQATEAKGGKGTLVDKDSRSAQMNQLAASETTIGVRADENKITVEYQNTGHCTVNYYLIDIEFLFSKSPFSDDYGSQFGLVMPNKVAEMDLPAGKNMMDFNVPKEFASSSFLVEITASGKKSATVRFANTMSVNVEDNYGQVKVSKRDGGAPMSKVYVKAYVRMKDGSVKFHRDGYTDLRGRFDYATLSADVLDQVDRFAILMMSEADGAVVKEAKPPKR